MIKIHHFLNYQLKLQFSLNAMVGKLLFLQTKNLYIV